MLDAGECICFPGFSGADCSVLPPVGSAFHSAAPIVRGKKCSRDCSGHGLCDDGTCWCEDKWTGTDCSQSERRPLFPPPPFPLVLTAACGGDVLVQWCV
jgi:hypothetical protein